MALTFPVGFPADRLAAVVRADSEATLAFRGATREQPGDRRTVLDAVATYFNAVMHAFARQACDAARSGHWPVDDIDSVVSEDFFRRLAAHAFYEFKLSRWETLATFRETANQQLRASSEWDEHLAERAAAARAVQERRNDDARAAATAGETSTGTSDTVAAPTAAVVAPGKALLEKFKQRVHDETGRRPTDADFISAAGYMRNSRNLLKPFLENPSGRAANTKRFLGVLLMEPRTFWARVDKKRTG